VDTIYNPYQHLHAPNELIVDGQPFETEDVPARAEILLEAVRQASLGQILEPLDHGLEPILAVHDPDFVQYLQEIYPKSADLGLLPVVPETFATRRVRHRPRNLYGRKGYYAFGVGSPVMEYTWQAAYWSAQSAITAARALLAGQRSVYALCRPPGHHAARDLYGGFCYLNNAAIAARFLSGAIAERVLGGRVAILDIDYHHGNGTQEIFYNDPEVLYCSLHAHPDDDYPYFWGMPDELGEGPGLGTNRNFPLPQGIDNDGYALILERALDLIGQFDPQYLLVSVGFDTGIDDPAGGFNLTTEGFARIGRQIAALQLPTAIIQEGGYRLDLLGQYAVAFLEGFR
jgi:acetoin utilization deacetylase AcuC-like enzyme